MRELGTTESSHDLLICSVSIIYNNMIVRALLNSKIITSYFINIFYLMRFHLKLGEEKLDSVSGSRGEDPNTFLKNNCHKNISHSMLSKLFGDTTKQTFYNAA